MKCLGFIGRKAEYTWNLKKRKEKNNHHFNEKTVAQPACVSSLLEHGGNIQHFSLGTSFQFG